MRLYANTMDRSLHGAVSVYLNGNFINCGCIMADDHWGLVKCYKIENGSFVWDNRRNDLKKQYLYGDVIICNHWLMESRRIK